MKRQIPILIAATIFLLASCKKEKVIESHDADGAWDLRTVVCLCPLIDLEPGEQIWTFQIDDQSLTVVDNTSDEVYTGFDAGDYSIELSGDESTLMLQELEWGFELDGDELHIYNNPELDGPYITFTRAN